MMSKLCKKQAILVLAMVTGVCADVMILIPRLATA